MITSYAKINLGLNVVEKRPDGYHNLQTVFYPVALKDSLEVFAMEEDFPSEYDCDIKVTNIHVEGDEQRNLVVKAYNILKEDFPSLPRLHAHLHKVIPTQAGMGGGSSDASAMLLLLNRKFQLKLTEKQLITYATRLGADCPFFIINRPSYAEGIGERLEPVNLDLSNWYIAIVRPDIPVPTKEAFARITPAFPQKCCKDIISQPVETWRDELTNDFEHSVFAIHPELSAIKQQLYHLGATYAAMSGSGSALFGLFKKPIDIKKSFGNMFSTCFKMI